jgi:hypothetical protein
MCWRARACPSSPIHLDVHLAALERGFDLSDASAYNVQFQGASPVFIDHLSLRPYRDGAVWTAHRQFCMQFLNPLLCHTLLKIAPNTLFRGSLEGIEPELLAPLTPLPLASKRRWIETGVVAHDKVRLAGSSAREPLGVGGRVERMAVVMGGRV